MVFSAPNLSHFKEFFKINDLQRKIYYTPMWQWNEIEALHRVSTHLQASVHLQRDVQQLFQLWVGLPRQIFVPYQRGFEALECTISACNALACIQILEIGNNFLHYGGANNFMQFRCKLMHFNVEDDKTYETAIVDFGSPFIRDRLVEESGNSCATYYREFLKAHRSREYAAKVRGNLYECLVLNKLRGLSADVMVMGFTMEKDKPNTAVTMFTIPALPHQQYSALGDIGELGRVWIPQQSNFKSFDVLIARPLPADASLWVQITVGKTHSLLAEDVHDCFQRCQALGAVGTIVFCVPPDIFAWWHEHNSVQSFVTQGGGEVEAVQLQYLNTLKQVVLCIPGDAVEEEMVESHS